MSNTELNIKQEARVVLIKAKDKLQHPVICVFCSKERSSKIRCEHCGRGSSLKGEDEC